MKKLKRKLEKEKNEKIYDKEEVERLKYAVFEEFGTIEKEHYLIKQGFSRIIPFKCKGCYGIKVLQYQYLPKFDKISQCDVCSNCTEVRSDQIRKCNNQNIILFDLYMWYYIHITVLIFLCINMNDRIYKTKSTGQG